MNDEREDPISAARELVEAGGGTLPQEGGSLRTALANAMVGMKKQFYGRGPTAAKAWILDDYVFVAMEGGLTRNEETLLADGKEDLVRSYRLSFEETVGPKVMAAVAGAGGPQGAHLSQPDRVSPAANVRDLRARTSVGLDVAELARRWQLNGDRAARDELVRRHMPLARTLAARYARTQEPFEDLFQVASLGLVKAADRYDPERGAAFSSYRIADDPR